MVSHLLDDELKWLFFLIYVRVVLAGLPLHVHSIDVGHASEWIHFQPIAPPFLNILRVHLNEKVKINIMVQCIIWKFRWNLVGGAHQFCHGSVLASTIHHHLKSATVKGCGCGWGGGVEAITWSSSYRDSRILFNHEACLTSSRSTGKLVLDTSLSTVLTSVLGETLFFFVETIQSTPLAVSDLPF